MPSPVGLGGAGRKGEKRGGNGSRVCCTSCRRNAAGGREGPLNDSNVVRSPSRKSEEGESSSRFGDERCVGARGEGRGEAERRSPAGDFGENLFPREKYDPRSTVAAARFNRTRFN